MANILNAYSFWSLIMSLHQQDQENANVVHLNYTKSLISLVEKIAVLVISQNPTSNGCGCRDGEEYDEEHEGE